MELYIVKNLTIDFDYELKKFTFNRSEPDGLIKSVFTNKYVAINYGVKESKRYLYQNLLQQISLSDPLSEPNSLNDTEKAALLNKICSQ